MYILLIILVLILVNSYFSAAEIAFVSVKKFKIQEEADKGNATARQILKYQQNPDEYLSTIQVGLTLIGLVEGLYGGEVFTAFLEPKFIRLGLSSGFAHTLSNLIGIGLITYVTVIVGELLPKSLALQQPQKLAFRIAPSFKIFNFLAYPFVKVLTFSTRLLLRLIHAGKPDNQVLTDTDLKSLLSQAYRQGTLEKEELTLHENIFNFYDQNVEGIMTPLNEVIFIPSEMDPKKADEVIRGSAHNYFPVTDGQNKLLGYLSARDYFKDTSKAIRDQIKSACTLEKNQKASILLQKFKEHNQNFGIVIDDRGEVFGLVTMHDIGEALLGQIP